MIPSVLARQLDQGIRDFIGATFPLASPYFEGMVEEFLNKPGNVFKGPYYQIGLPFRHGENEGIPFDTIQIPGFLPWAHQDIAWKRLGGEEPQSVIVATGTGSGKTECFLFPILDYCARHREKGIKAIILYPMNALADDQARRLAKLIDEQSGLSGIRAGVYTGSASETRVKTMGPNDLITDRDTLREYPPDILLTNYKMLDLLLLRAKDRSLWNAKALKFLVVDEIHSFDGAQGTDLACLIRRLRERLERSDPDSLACVGTSATLGTGDDARTELLDFARKVFHANFGPEALIEESRETEREFLADAWINRVGLPDVETVEQLRPFPKETEGFADSMHTNEFVERQMRVWFPDIEWSGKSEDRITLGKELKGHGVFQNILRYTEGRARSGDELIAHIRKTWAPSRSWTNEHVSLCLDSLFALVSYARRMDGSRVVPFITLRTQFWMRELRRLVAGIVTGERQNAVPLRLADELPPSDKRTWLPVVHCRECNSVGWLTRESPGEAPVIKDLRSIYNGYFGESKDTIVLYPIEVDALPPEGATKWGLCPECGFLSHESALDCAHCHHGTLLPVWKARLINTKGKFDSACPRCGSAGDLTIMGSKAASLLAALVGQTFSSPFNSDKKLLAFSDSVQDAAHRAGFLTARAWTFSFRTALCDVIPTHGAPIALDDLLNNFLSYWKEKTETPERFLGTFLPPDQEWRTEYDDLIKNGQLPSNTDIVSRISTRLSWELVSELTFRSRIGRTLERTGTAIAYVDHDSLRNAARILFEVASERQERFRTIEEDHPFWHCFLWGIVYRFKNLGAIDDPSIVPLFNLGAFGFARSYKNMPSFMKRAPHIVTEKPSKPVHEPLYATDSRRSWFETWLIACMDTLISEFQLDTPGENRELLALCMSSLISSGIVTDKTLSGDQTGWLLNPNKLTISAQVSQLRCSVCHSSLDIADDELDTFERMPCLRAGCGGIWQKDTAVRSDYYRNFYRRGEVIRINGREHTGLLGGKQRKALEDAFISGKHPWDPNLLSATPTLEMGINIGDLSTVFLCSIPPGVANFLQRVGRAGRVDGNSHVIAMANSVPHDQYFFQSPQEMIEGAVDTPAIYDHAVAVLERHLTAFAMARWTRDVPPSFDPVPKTVGDLVAARNSQNGELFPLGFLAALERERYAWLGDFLSVFDHLEKEERDYLGAWCSSDPGEEKSLPRTLLASIDFVSSNMAEMRSRRSMLRKKAAEIREQGALTEELSKECDDLEREAEGLNSGIRALTNTDTWQFLCDEGILPNYAFPETGVKLKATFYRKSRDNLKGPFDYSHVELVRSATSALREFAPENEFFGNGHRMKINRVDLKSSKLETWRFCPACSHAVSSNHAHFNLSECPSCGHLGWKDIGQVHTLLRFKQVYSFSSFQDSLISDNQEDREPVFYNTKLLMDFDPGDPDNHYFGLADKHSPIAIEFIRRATFREFNFGKVDGGPGGFSVAGELDSKCGFPVCTECGTVDQKNHAPECSFRKIADSDKASKEVIHLYHEFTSEAIRILVPVNEYPLEADIAMESAIAGIYLGLKKHFGGRADHLRIMQERSERPGGASLRYLVVYDSIPGGSGYLKDFFTEAKANGTTTFFSVVQHAVNTLKGCSCKLEAEKDGCYKCVLSHKVSRKMKDVSRSMAIKILERLLEEQANLVRTSEQASIRVDPLYDSRLEELFIGVLQTPDLWPVAVSVKPELFREKTGHYVQIGTRGYHLEQQAPITVREPLTASTIADFVFHPTTAGEKPIVVYTDGFTFHKSGVANDLRIRQALIASGMYRVFAFSWDDVSSVAEKRPSESERLGFPWIVPQVPPQFARLIRQFSLRRDPWPGCDEVSGLKAFVAMLALPERERDALWLDKARESAINTFFSSTPGLLSLDELSLKSGLVFAKGSRYAERELLPGSEHQLTIVQEPIAGQTIPALTTWLLFDDVNDFDRLTWNSMLELINLYQILPRFAFNCRTRATGNDWMSAAFSDNEPEESNGDWVTLEGCILSTWIPLLRHIQENGFPLPEVGYEEVDSSGIVLFNAEIAWPDKKVAIIANAGIAEDSVPGWTLKSWAPELPFPILNLGENQ